MRGKEVPKTFPTKEELNELPKKEDGSRDTEFLPRDTVGNVILNCLEQYVSKDNKDGFRIITIAQLILSTDTPEELEMTEKLKKFTISVLNDSIYRETEEVDEKGSKKTKGMYFSWVISQALVELGVEAD